MLQHAACRWRRWLCQADAEPKEDGGQRSGKAKIIGRADADQIDQHAGERRANRLIELPDRTANCDGVREYRLSAPSAAAEPSGSGGRKRARSLRRRRRHDVPERHPFSRIKVASTKTVDAEPICEKIMIRLRSVRSAMTPPSRVNAIVGVEKANPVSPRRRGELVNSSTSQPCATALHVLRQDRRELAEPVETIVAMAQRAHSLEQTLASGMSFDRGF